MSKGVQSASIEPLAMDHSRIFKDDSVPTKGYDSLRPAGGHKTGRYKMMSALLFVGGNTQESLLGIP